MSKAEYFPNLPQLLVARYHREEAPEFTCTIGDVDMNKDRIAGAVKEIRGSIKETVGKAAGDAKLEADGRADKVEGKIQNVIGGLKDTLKN